MKDEIHEFSINSGLAIPQPALNKIKIKGIKSTGWTQVSVLVVVGVCSLRSDGVDFLAMLIDELSKLNADTSGHKLP